MKAFNLRSDTEFELVVMSEEIYYKEILNLNIKIHYLIRKAKKDISIFKKFYSICKNYKPDIVHCWDGMTAVYSVIPCKLLKIKLVNGMVTDTPVNQTIFNTRCLRAKLTFPFSSIIVGNSEAGLTAYSASKKKSVCIYNGIDLIRFDKLKAPSMIQKEIFKDESNNFFVAGMVAAFENRKDYKTLIKAAISLVSENDNIRFILVGDGTDFIAIKKSIPPLLSNPYSFVR